MFSVRSSTKDKKMVVSKEISNYFTKLVGPLVTKQRLNEKKIHSTESKNSGFGGENRIFSMVCFSVNLIRFAINLDFFYFL